MNVQNQTSSGCGLWCRTVRLAIILLFLCGCASIAISAAKPKRPSAAQTELAKQANDAFWAALHAGAYEQIPDVKEQLQRAYLTDPNDAATAAHLGFLHIWAISERSRLPKLEASITDHMLLSQRYFTEAVEMTHDPRFEGFLAVTELANGTIHKDERLLRTGYFRLEKAVDDYPEFNLFSRGFTRSSFPVDHEFFKKGLEDMWKNIDVCLDATIDRANPDYTRYMAAQTTEGLKRVCWNGWIAPHNHEGFALNLGDMLVKAGDVKAARVMYANAKLSKTFDRWPYRDVLERRIAEAEENVEHFRKKADEQPEGHRMMIASEFSCSGCHADDQRGGGGDSR